MRLWRLRRKRHPGGRAIQLGVAAVVASGVLVLSGGVAGGSGPAGPTAEEALWSLRTGLAAAVVQIPSDSSVERSAPAKLRLDLLLGGAGLVVLAMALVRRQPIPPGSRRRPRFASWQVALERGPPLLTVSS